MSATAAERVKDSQPGTPRLLVERVSKTFGRQRVLKNVTIELQPGELHALVGQNGSGKSTLAKILTGVHAADPGGHIEVDGISLGPLISVADMRHVGLSVVHQSLGLLPDHTVVENVRVGRYRGSRWLRRIDWQHERASVASVLERLGCVLDLDARVAGLSAEDRATVAIARAFQDHHPGSGLIIFDESTRALNTGALARFYEMVNTVRASGVSVLLISHRLEEVLDVSDRVTVLRDGEVTAAGVETSTLDEPALVRLMIGRDLRAGRARRPERSPDTNSQPRLVVSDLGGRIARDISFGVGAGEILGVTGLVGSGFEEIPYLIAGARPAMTGQLTVGAETFDLPELHSPIRRLAHAGVALVPERRAEEGLAMDMTVQENITLPRAHTVGSPVWLGRGWQQQQTVRMIEKLDIRPPQPEAPVGTLSGGNQQKVLLAKWLAGDPVVLLLHEPTQAVDIAAREDIIEAIREAASGGCAVLVAGSDPQELAALCHRVLVIRDGQVAEELTGELDEDRIVHATFATG